MELIAALTALALMLIGLLHALWPVVPWPFHSRLELARATMGWEADQAPDWWFAPACLGVTLLLAIASWVLLIRAETWPTSFPAWDVSGVIPWGIAAVFVARGAWGLVDPGSGSATAPAIYRRLNRRVYAPLSLVLGLLSGAVAAS